MKQTIGQSQFIDAFHHAGRGDQFSYEALTLLFDYLAELENGTGEEIELDVIAICCEYEESDWRTLADDYDIDLEECNDDEEKEAAVLEYLEGETQVIGQTATSIVYAQF